MHIKHAIVHIKQRIGFFRICFVGLMAAIFYFISFGRALSSTCYLSRQKTTRIYEFHTYTQLHLFHISTLNLKI